MKFSEILNHYINKAILNGDNCKKLITKIYYNQDEMIINETRLMVTKAENVDVSKITQPSGGCTVCEFETTCPLKRYFQNPEEGNPTNQILFPEDQSRIEYAIVSSQLGSNQVAELIEIAGRMANKGKSPLDILKKYDPLNQSKDGKKEMIDIVVDRSVIPMIDIDIDKMFDDTVNDV